MLRNVLRANDAEKAPKSQKNAHNDVEASLAPSRVFRRCTVEKTPDLRDFETIRAAEGKATVIGTLTGSIFMRLVGGAYTGRLLLGGERNGSFRRGWSR